MVSYNFISINVAKPEVPALARNASFGLWMEKDLLVRDVSKRLLVRQCDSRQCFEDKTRRQSPNNWALPRKYAISQD